MKYEWGECQGCGKKIWLMNGKCAICNRKEPQSDVVNDIMSLFGGKK